MMQYDAMLVVDMQTALTQRHPYRENEVVQTIQMLIQLCREKKIPVLYIRHDGGVGDELERGCAGWEIDKRLAPLPDEIIFDKQFNSAFRKTELHEHLQKIHTKNVILCGMQTEYCIDATCKVAFEYGYNLIIPKGTTTTYDNPFAKAAALCAYYEDQIWDGRYAQMMPAEVLSNQLKAITVG